MSDEALKQMLDINDTQMGSKEMQPPQSSPKNYDIVCHYLKTTDSACRQWS